MQLRGLMCGDAWCVGWGGVSVCVYGGWRRCNTRDNSSFVDGVGRGMLFMAAYGMSGLGSDDGGKDWVVGEGGGVHMTSRT